jgi:SAM-dependent methyltransferase
MLVRSLKQMIQQRAEHNSNVQSIIRKIAHAIGYDLTRVTRVAYGAPCRDLISYLGPSKLDVIEVSPGENRDWRSLGFRSYRALDYPDFDACAQPLDPDLIACCDLVIADQVLEHLLWPLRGVRNLYAMLRPGGHALVMTPFLLRIHGGPQDCCRWSDIGLRHLLAEGGFPIDNVRTWSWGNRRTVIQLLDGWPRMGWRRVVPPNQPKYPVVVWALARKPVD